MSRVARPRHGAKKTDRANPLDPPPPDLDWRDLAAVRAWLNHVELNFEDLVSAGEDALRPLGKRKLGRANARPMLLAAARAIEKELGRAERGLLAIEPR